MRKDEVYDFDPSRYAPRMKEAAARFEAANSFCEADRVAVQMPIGGSYFARMFGYNIRDYYTDIETNNGVIHVVDAVILPPTN